jgi:hypothetical protein
MTLLDLGDMWWKLVHHHTLFTFRDLIIQSDFDQLQGSLSSSSMYARDLLKDEAD